MRTLYVPEVFREFDRFFTDPNEYRSASSFGDYDWRETDNGYLLSVDVPGMGPDEIKLEVTDQMLTISGERKLDEKDQRVTKRFYGKFQRSFSLPSEAATDKVEARYDKGVLELFVPKHEKAKPRLIKIGTAGESLFAKLLPKNSNA